MKQVNNQRGFTLIELIISLGVSVIVIGGAYEFFMNGMNSYKQSLSRARSNEQVRQGMDAMTAVIREARSADNGSYAVAQATATSLTFYANIDSDVAVEQVTYSLTGTQLVRTVIKPTGVPPQYPAGNAVTTTLQDNVRSLQFNYFDKNYTGTQAALTQPVAPLDVRLVRITVTIDDDPTKPPAAVTLTTAVMLRNLKDNL